MSEFFNDPIGTPEFFVEAICKIETAGAGNVRMYCCIKRGDEWILTHTTVMPAEALLLASRQCNAAAQEAFNTAQIIGVRTAH